MSGITSTEDFFIAFRCYRILPFAYLSLTVFTEGGVALRKTDPTPHKGV